MGLLDARCKDEEGTAPRYTRRRQREASLNVVQRVARVSFGAFLSTKLKRNTLSRSSHPSLVYSYLSAVVDPAGGDAGRGDRDEGTTTRSLVGKRAGKSK